MCRRQITAGGVWPARRATAPMPVGYPNIYRRKGNEIRRPAQSSSFVGKAAASSRTSQPSVCARSIHSSDASRMRN
jgi:hypothetical protein